MDPSKLIPAGSVRLHAVLTLKEKGDVAKIKEDLKKVFAATHRWGECPPTARKLLFLGNQCHFFASIKLERADSSLESPS